MWEVTCFNMFGPLQIIYELTQGERQLIDDLSLVKKVGTCINSQIYLIHLLYFTVTEQTLLTFLSAQCLI